MRVALLAFFAIGSAALSFADAVAISPILVVGTVNRLVYGPGGRADGVVLQDHTFIGFRSESLINPSALRYGDRVVIRGVQVLSKPNRVLNRVIIKKAGQLILDESKVAPSLRSSVEIPVSNLKSTSDTSNLFAVSARPDGAVDRLILEDGSVVRVPAAGYVDPNRLQLEQEISAQGVGITVQNMKFIDSMNIQSADQSTLLGTRGGFGEAWGTKIGTVKQLLMTPYGLSDGVVLTDNSAVRFDPVPPDQLFDLTAGTQIQAAGPARANQLHSDYVVLPALNKTLAFQSPSARAPGTNAAGTIPGANVTLVPKNLSVLKDLGRVQTVLRGPEQKIESIILGDGTTIRVPPRLQASISSTVGVGDVVEVSGLGGNYPQGTAIEASSVNLANG